MNPNDMLTEQQKWILAIVPRIAAGISVICTVGMAITILKSPWARSRIYHRLMLGCTLPILIQNTAQLWGPSAAPSDTDWVIGATGNYTTCSIQGFMYQFRLVVPSYYLILSLLARRLVIVGTTATSHNKQQQQQQQRSNNTSGNAEIANTRNRSSNRKNIQAYMLRLKKLEPFLHVAVYVFPIVSGLYLLSIEGFNMILLGCGVSSEPLGCGDDSGIECTRGPQNPGFYQWILAGLPGIILLGSATLIMIVTFIQMCCSKNSSKQVAISMAKQSSLYLFAYYWTYIFRWIDAALILNRDTYVFAVNLLAEIIDPLQGLWTLMVYWYFKSDTPKTAPPSNSEYYFDESSNEHSTTSINKRKNNKILPVRRTSSSQSDDSMRSRVRPEFSIFDGSTVNRDSPWAAYLMDDGEDSGYMEFCGEYTDKDVNVCGEGRTISSTTFQNVSSTEEKEEEQSFSSSQRSAKSTTLTPTSSPTPLILLSDKEQSSKSNKSSTRSSFTAKTISIVSNQTIDEMNEIEECELMMMTTQTDDE